jgi:hypothetical protein
MRLLLLSFLCFTSTLFSQEPIGNLGNVNVFSNAEIGVFGDFINNGIFTSSGGTIYLTGTDYQLINGNSKINTYNTVLNNDSSAKLDNQLEVQNVFTFAKGKLITDRSDATTEFLNFLAGSSYTGFDDAKFVDGVVRKTGNSAFVFPVGDSIQQQAISISAPSVITDHFTGFYQYADPMDAALDPTLFGSGINNVSRCEYWVMNPTGGNSTVRMTLNFDLFSCGIYETADLLVVRWNGTEWVTDGSVNISGLAENGTIEMDSPCLDCGSFNAFTLASSSPLNPLPVELLFFDAKLNNERKVDLIWQTASEHNNDYFSIERSQDGENFEVITIVPGAGNSNDLLSYLSKDENPFPGISYYRLKQTDYDGAFEYSPLKVVQLLEEGIVSIYPNPSSSGVVNFSSANAIGNLKVFSSDGKMVFNENVENTVNLQLQSGVYHAVFNQNGESVSQKIVVAH